MFDPLSGGRRGGESADDSPYAHLPGYSDRRKGFYSARFGDDLAESALMEKSYEADKKLNDSYINAYRLAGQHRQLADKPPATNLGAEIGKTALSTGVGAAVTAGFALI